MLLVQRVVDGEVFAVDDPDMPAEEVRRRLGTEPGGYRWLDPLPLPELPRLTVADLRRWLAQFPSNWPVVVDDGKGWYAYIGDVNGPVRDESDQWDDQPTGYVVPTLFPGGSFDSRGH